MSLSTRLAARIVRTRVVSIVASKRRRTISSSAANVQSNGVSKVVPPYSLQQFDVLSRPGPSSLPHSLSSGTRWSCHQALQAFAGRSFGTSAFPEIDVNSSAAPRPPAPMKRAENIKETMELETALNILRAYSVSNHTINLVLHVSMRDPALKKSRERAPITGVAIYPHGFQRGKKVAVLCDENEVDAVLDAGADHVGGTELVESVVSASIDFELLLASSAILPKLKKFGGQLRALMPSVKKGTASDNIVDLLKQYKAGQAFKSDKDRNITCAVAKIDFTNDQINENLAVFLASLMEHNLLGQPHLFVKRMFIKTSQSPNIELPSRKVLEKLL